MFEQWGAQDERIKITYRNTENCAMLNETEKTNDNKKKQKKSTAREDILFL